MQRQFVQPFARRLQHFDTQQTQFSFPAHLTTIPKFPNGTKSTVLNQSHRYIATATTFQNYRNTNSIRSLSNALRPTPRAFAQRSQRRDGDRTQPTNKSNHSPQQPRQPQQQQQKSQQSATAITDTTATDTPKPIPFYQRPSIRFGAHTAVVFTPLSLSLIYLSIRYKLIRLYNTTIPDPIELQDFVDRNHLAQRFPGAWGFENPNEAHISNCNEIAELGLKNILIYHQLLQLIPDALSQCQQLKSIVSELIEKEKTGDLTITSTSKHQITFQNHYLFLELIDGISSSLNNHTNPSPYDFSAKYIGALTAWLAEPESGDRPKLLTRWWLRWGPRHDLSRGVNQLNGRIQEVKTLLLDLEAVIAMTNSITNQEWREEFVQTFSPPEPVQEGDHRPSNDIALPSPSSSSSPPPLLSSISTQDLLDLINYQSLATQRITSATTLLGHQGRSPYLIDTANDLLSGTISTISPPNMFRRGLMASLEPINGLLVDKNTKKATKKIKSTTLNKKEYNYYKRIANGSLTFINDSNHKRNIKTKPQIDLSLLPIQQIGPDATRKLIQLRHFETANSWFFNQTMRFGLPPFFWTYIPPNDYSQSRFVTDKDNSNGVEGEFEPHQGDPYTKFSLAKLNYQNDPLHNRKVDSFRVGSNKNE